MPVADEAAGADVALGVVGLVGVGEDDACGGGGMDETETACGGVDIRHDAGMADASRSAAALPED